MQNLMPPINTPDQLFHDGDPTQGIEGTLVTAGYLNNQQGQPVIYSRNSLMFLVVHIFNLTPKKRISYLPRFARCC